MFPEQSGAVSSPSIDFEPEFIWFPEGGGPELRLSPMLRLDAHDASRTHFDLREANALWLRDGWTLMAGVGKVFWGTTESVHLVDIINQSDAVEDIDNEEKLGQPMVNFTLERDWGVLDLYVLPFFRERTHAASEGRLRGLAPVLDEAVYESDAGRWHTDFAARWSHAIGDVDLGVAGFYGTSREPYLLPIDAERGLALQPYYTIIDQFSVDVQYTRGATLWKLEAMMRGGHGDRFAASVFGVEHTLFSVGPGPADLGLLAEMTLDGRSDQRRSRCSTTTFLWGFVGRSTTSRVRQSWAGRLWTWTTGRRSRSWRWSADSENVGSVRSRCACCSTPKARLHCIRSGETTS